MGKKKSRQQSSPPAPPRPTEKEQTLSLAQVLEYVRVRTQGLGRIAAAEANLVKAECQWEAEEAWRASLSPPASPVDWNGSLSDFESAYPFRCVFGAAAELLADACWVRGLLEEIGPMQLELDEHETKLEVGIRNLEFWLSPTVLDNRVVDVRDIQRGFLDCGRKWGDAIDTREVETTALNKVKMEFTTAFNDLQRRSGPPGCAARSVSGLLGPPREFLKKMRCLRNLVSAWDGLTAIMAEVEKEFTATIQHVEKRLPSLGVDGRFEERNIGAELIEARRKRDPVVSKLGFSEKSAHRVVHRVAEATRGAVRMLNWMKRKGAIEDGAPDKAPPPKRPWYHEPAEARPDEYKHGPVTGTQKFLSYCVGDEWDAKRPRRLKHRGERGVVWVVRFSGQKWEVWFRSQESYAHANARKIAAGDRNAPQ